jgi:hypothetical protein
MNRYDVWMRSTPGFYEQYNGKVSVVAEDDTAAIEAAFRELKRTTFKDRNRSMWKVEKVERKF